MARPRIFVSSTYYDLKYLRAALESFIIQMGYDPILFEKGAIPFHHDQSLEQSCYDEVKLCDMLVLIIGGRWGSKSVEDEAIMESTGDAIDKIRSVTHREYDTALEREIPIFIFVDQAVYAEYRTYKANKENETIIYVHVDDRRIYKLIDEIMLRKQNSYIKEFSNTEDIPIWLREQWAGIFHDILKGKSQSAKIRDLEDQLKDLRNLSSTLKEYNEIIVRAVNKSESNTIIEDVRSKEEIRTKALAAGKFCRKDLIMFLKKRSNKKMTSLEIFELFQESGDLDGFIKKIGIDEGTASLDEPIRSIADADFRKYKKELEENVNNEETDA